MTTTTETKAALRRVHASAPIHGFKFVGDTGDGDDAPGTFEAIVSVFNNVDLAGDRILPGAFEASIERWKASGDPVPVIFSHQWDNLDAHVGEVDPEDMEELAAGDERLPSSIRNLGGLYVKGRLHLDEDFASRLARRMRSRAIREFSFAYDVFDERANGGVNELVELDVIEVGPTLKGANPLTALLEAKSDAGEAVRLLAENDVDLDELWRRLSAPANALVGAPDPDGTKTDDEDTEDDTKTDDADGTKAGIAGVPFAGSHEERMAHLYGEALAWAQANDVGNGGFYAAYLEATFADHVILLVEGWNDPIREGAHYRADIVTDDDGLEHLSDPVPVEVVAGVRTASARNAHRFEKARLKAAEAKERPDEEDDTKAKPAEGFRRLSPTEELELSLAEL